MFRLTTHAAEIKEGFTVYRLLSISGTDAESFLQGQLTQDVTRLKDVPILTAAWCNPKGRVIATMNIIRLADRFGLLLPADIAGSVLQRISIYRLRADVQLRLDEEFQGIALQSDQALQRLECSELLPRAKGGAHCRKGCLTALCISVNPMVVEVFGPATGIAGLLAEHALDKDPWSAALIRSGKVRIGTENSEKYTPHMLSLDLSGAVSFDKGCYPGQEIVARTEHRSHSRRRLARYECEAASNAAGDQLYEGEVPVGTVVNALDHDVLAVTPAKLQAKPLMLNGRTAKPLPLFDAGASSGSLPR